MSLLSIEDLTMLGIGTDLSSADLETVIDREDDEIVRRYGAHFVNSTTTLTEIAHGGGSSLYLKRAITSITSVTESLYLGDSAPIVLTTADYYAWPSEGRLQRLSGYGPAGARWGAVVTVVYVPQNDNALRSQVLIDLVRLSLERRASGTWNETKTTGTISHTVSGGVGATGWDEQRASVMRRLGYLST